MNIARHEKKYEYRDLGNDTKNQLFTEAAVQRCF